MFEFSTRCFFFFSIGGQSPKILEVPYSLLEENSAALRLVILSTMCLPFY